MKPTTFLIDVDGVMTTGQFFYSENGKVMKAFGPDDNDALELLRPHIEIKFISGDKRGFKISHKRIVEDMRFSLDLVSTIHRLDWIREKFDPTRVIYMGDGIFDCYVMRGVSYGIAPANADESTKKSADHVTKRRGGDRAVAEACLHIMDRFFEAFDPSKTGYDALNFSGDRREG
ncbi:MAG: phosphatase [Oceanospirillales bacterium TMED59]|jgi:3-deoxy-D-manno-octulosonate 8-phosphate phosphatase (KDO 8-P phosphatase)|nr:MAG: phosphatase [Oceanospirillales bacterium TMED59]|tara:strand:- start:1092 stop:1616 length:525 start_codon:yes stop_codon:yes gene_type:complete